MACPICKRPADKSGPYRPFCSARCKEVDLGRWLGEEYKLSRPLNLEEVRELQHQEEAQTADLPNLEIHPGEASVPPVDPLGLADDATGGHEPKIPPVE